MPKAFPITVSAQRKVLVTFKPNCLSRGEKAEVREGMQVAQDTSCRRLPVPLEAVGLSQETSEQRWE